MGRFENMVGRGRGTGLSFNTEVLGFNRGDALPTAMLAPPPTFPPLTNPPVKLLKDVEHEYTYTASKDLNAWFRASPYYLGRDQPIPQLDLPWERFPKELRPGGLKKRKLVTKVKMLVMMKKKKLKTQMMMTKKVTLQVGKKMQRMKKWMVGQTMRPITLIMVRDMAMTKMIMRMKEEFIEKLPMENFIKDIFFCFYGE